MSESETQIKELQQRIPAAMLRIDRGLETLSTPATSEADVLRLTAALDEERLANAQLEERVRAIKARQDESVSKLEQAVKDQAEAARRLDGALQQLQAANAQLRENNAALRAANAEGVGDPTLINRSLQAEVEALRAARIADRAEADAILGALGPLVAGGTPVPALDGAMPTDATPGDDGFVAGLTEDK